VQAIIRERVAADALRGTRQELEPGEPALVFSAPTGHLPLLELVVNFGPFAGREATPAEIDELGRMLLSKVGRVTVVSEQHYEIGPNAEGAVHQVRIEVGSDAVPRADCDLAELRGRLIEVTERWAQACIGARHQDLTEP
jgi:hypothetical protein